MSYLSLFEPVIMNSFARFPLELIIAEIPFLLNQQKRHHFALRAALGFVIYMVFSVFWRFSVIHFLIGEANSINGIPAFFLYFVWALISCIPIILAFDISAMEVLFAVASGYASEHICFAVIRIFLYYSKIGADSSFGWYVFFHYIAYILWDIVIYQLLVKRNADKDQFKKGDIRIAMLGIVVMIVAIGLSVVYTTVSYDSVITNVVCPAYSTICCGLVLIMEYYVLRENGLKEEQKTMEQLLEMSTSTQKSSKEAIDIINLKCHDLKHQIKALANMESNDERAEYINEVQRAVSIYDATFHTGCEALDYVLREKMLISNEHNVAFSCMADGSLVSCMSPTDIYALFGNALENALECVVTEKEDERLISLHITEQSDMVLIHLENRCSKRVKFQDGLPITSKKDKNYHGFGLRSIKYIAGKYDGQLFMSCQDGKFYTDVLIPIR